MKLEPFFQRDFSGGMTSNLNSALAPQNTVELAVNVEFDEEIGSATTRLGRFATGDVPIVSGMSVLGLHQHVDHANSSNNVLMAAMNVSGGATAAIHDVATGDTITGATGLTASAKVRFLTFGGATLAINGADAERSYTSAGWITTGGAFDLGDFPGSNSCDLAIEFLDRVYAAGDSSEPDRLHFSTVYDGSAISWAGDYIDIEPEDGGGAITALAKVPGYLLIFKQRSLKRYNGSSTYPESLVQIGAPSQEAVVMGGGLCAFYSNSNVGTKGFYITDGGRPVCISNGTRPIKKWVDAIAAASEANVAGWATDNVFAWSVGDLTVDGETYNNVVLRYNYKLNQWNVRTYSSEFKVFANNVASGVNYIAGGDDNGTVYNLDVPGVYNDGAGATAAAMQWRLRTHHHHFGFNQIKTITDKVLLRGRQLQSATINIIPDEDLTSRVPTTGTLKRILSLFNIGSTVRGTTFSVEITGEITDATTVDAAGSCVYLREIEIPSIEVNSSYD